MPPMRTSLLWIAVLVVACSRRDDPAWAQMPNGGTAGESTISDAPMKVRRFAQAPLLDGKLDDVAWTDAATTAPFVEPGKGGEARGSDVAAFAKLGWDDRSFYVGAVIFDSSPVSPFGRDDVDPHDWEKSSALELMVQPGDPGNNTNYYEIQIDVHGATFDTKWDDYNTPRTNGPAGKIFGHQDWSSKAERAIYVSDGRFYALEIAIPWAAFGAPPKPGDVWRLNLYSFKDGQRQALAWSPIRGQGNFHRSSRFGRIQFE
jgi:Carbohydrate family 9 binding domain-like